MAVCDVQTLLDVDPCLSALSARMLKLVKISILCGIKTKLEGGAEPTCDIQTLLDSANCYDQLSDFSLDVLEAQLLCDIAGLV